MSRRRTGFTLIEVIVAIGLLLVLSGIMFAFLFELLSTRDQVRRHVAMERAATTMIDRIEADLLGCIVGDDHAGAGIEGTNETLTILSRAVSVEHAERGVDDPVPFGDLQQSEYRFDERSRTIEVRRSVVSDRLRARGSMSGLGGSISHVRFRYYDGTDWLDRYDSLAADRLPVAVEVAVWFGPWPEDEARAAEEARFGDQFADDQFADDQFADDRFGDDRFGDDPFADDRVALGAGDEDLPFPDRIRIIPVPDAAVDDGSEESIEVSRPEGDVT
ncbi:MAG: prepilin-type N-terminal cleavage/methylation domain-containing protein [Phycisphaerales bacterium]|nr:prepilin-type N-terminal cleavage/methylation domain-containing protein [Phycisphaerales bacterium]